MNRNVESYFSTVPTMDINRSTFDRSQDIKLTFNVGELIPFYLDEVLPGDTFKIETSMVARMQTLLTPIMDNVYLDLYYFFVPYRLVWTHWKEFMGENTSSAWLPEVTYQIPQSYAYYLNAESNEHMVVHPGDYLDYMGIPVNVPASKGTASTAANAKLAGECLHWSQLPVRCVQLIWNEWFRDQNLQQPININTGDSDTRMYTDEERAAAGEGWRNVLHVSKYHDYFTSALPAPLKGEPVFAPVLTTTNDYSAMSNSPMKLVTGNGVKTDFYAVTFGENDYASTRIWKGEGDPPTAPLRPYNLGVNIMQLRNAFQVQKLLERDARSGTRYTEIIKGHFSVISPDSRLQRPEYLGGKRIPISIHQITNQSQGENDFLGDLGAMSLTTDKHTDFVQSFTEHGVVCGLLCARYDHSYPQGLERFWSRKTRFDFYWPEFANLSEMAVLNKEIYAQGNTTDDQVFGYQECWADYRYKPNRVCGEMRPGIDGTLASWHLADYYESLPYLSNDWIREDKTNVDRTLAVTSAVSNQLFADIYVQNFSTRPMPVRSIPGLADHF